MKPVLGLLMIGGGVVLMVALFTGRLGLPGLNIPNPFAGLPNTVTAPPQKTDKSGNPLPTPYVTDQNKQDCIRGGGVWVNGQCRHYVGGSGIGK